MMPKTVVVKNAADCSSSSTLKKTKKVQEDDNIPVLKKMKHSSSTVEEEGDDDPSPTSVLDDCSVSSVSEIAPSQSAVWSQPYIAPAVVDQTTILLAGFFLFGLALFWPPLLLLVAYLASKLIPYSFRINDEAAYRRQLIAEFEQSDGLPDKYKNVPDDVQVEQSYWVNSRGMLLSTPIMTPKTRPVTAVVCFCHGYTDDASCFKRAEYARFVRHGVAVAFIEYEGHGRSDGPLCLINDWDALVTDVAAYFAEVTQKRFPELPVFLMGESMGGAVAYCVYNRIPDIITGVVFVSPMCKISDDMLPPQRLIDLLRWLIGPSGTTSFLGRLPIAPAKGDFGDLAHHVPGKRDVLARTPVSFARNPRLATARELVKATASISASAAEFDAPFFIAHGKHDRITDPNLSRALYEESKSKDKTIKLYDDMWHGLTSTEPDDHIDLVFQDCIKWIMSRVYDINKKKGSPRRIQ